MMLDQSPDDFGTVWGSFLNGVKGAAATSLNSGINSALGIQPTGTAGVNAKDTVEEVPETALLETQEKNVIIAGQAIPKGIFYGVAGASLSLVTLAALTAIVRGAS